MFNIDPKLVQMLINYLGTRPYNQVADLMNVLSQTTTSRQIDLKLIQILINYLGNQPYNEVVDFINILSNLSISGN